MIAMSKYATSAFVAGALLCLLSGAHVARAQAQKPAAGTVAAKPAVSHVDPAGAEKLIKAKKVVVLDVRQAEEYRAGRIAGAKNIDFLADDFEKRLGELDKNQTYLVHCASGGRSTKSLTVFKRLGFKSIVHLDGGMRAWEQAGKDVQK
jgi:rhodanese-related sulfurtransferase